MDAYLIFPKKVDISYWFNDFLLSISSYGLEERDLERQKIANKLNRCALALAVVIIEIIALSWLIALLTSIATCCGCCCKRRLSEDNDDATSDGSNDKPQTLSDTTSMTGKTCSARGETTIGYSGPTTKVEEEAKSLGEFETVGRDVKPVESSSISGSSSSDDCIVITDESCCTGDWFLCRLLKWWQKAVYESFK